MTVKIGVLGGIGPEATGEFYSKLIHSLQQKGLIRSNKDFPQILVNSIPAPELIHEAVSDSDLRPYLEGLKELEKMDVDFIVMVCNTIHLYHSELQKKVGVPILDLRQQMRLVLERKGKGCVGVLGTPLTLKHGLYRFEGMKTFEPTHHESGSLTEAIFNFNRGFEKDAQVDKVKKVCCRYLNEGAETIVLGCTEFSVMLGNSGFPTLNAIDVMVEATIQRMLNTTFK